MLDEVSIDRWIAIAGVVVAIAFGVVAVVALYRAEKHEDYVKRKALSECFRKPNTQQVRTLLETAMYAHLLFDKRRLFSEAWVTQFASDLYDQKSLDDPSVLRVARLFIERVYIDRAGGTPTDSSSWIGQTREGHLEALDSIYAQAKAQFSAYNPPPPVIKNAFMLGKFQDGTPPVGDYFEGLQHLEAFNRRDMPIGPLDRFLTPIQVDSGFVAPLHLLTGLLTKVQEDWPRALAQLGGALARVSLASDKDGKIDPELRLDHFQAFEFSCWVLWGPSIPLCPCPMWSRENRVLQYGFGDESNSFQLLVDSEILWEQLVREFKDVGRPYPLAAQLSLTATPMWWAKPYDIIDNPMWHPADASAGNQNGTGSLVLRAETAHIVKEASSSVQYYSAYLWIMFEICDATGRLDWFRFGDWRRYLPIFEHTNIADGSTLTMLKELLAQKAITLIKDLEEMFLPEGGGPPDVYFRYVAAVDDPGGNNTHSVKLHFGGADQGLTLREWLERLADEELRQRLMSKQVAPETPARPQNACYFPILVNGFSPTNGS